MVNKSVNVSSNSSHTAVAPSSPVVSVREKPSMRLRVRTVTNKKKEINIS